MKIVYCGFDLFKDCLDSLIEAGHIIMAVYSFPTDNKHDFHELVARTASANGIKFTVGPLQKSELEKFADDGCDIILSAGYAYKIPACDRIPYRMNIHPSPLPYGRGAWPLACAIRKGVDEWAVTIHELSEGWDEGAIINQRKLAVAKDEKLESLSVKCQMLARTLLKEVMDDLDGFWKNRKPQGEGVYWRMPTLAERTIDWAWTIDEIDRHVRAYGKHGSPALLDGKNIFVKDVAVWKHDHGNKVGEVVWRANNEVVVAALDGLICIRFWEEVQDKL